MSESKENKSAKLPNYSSILKVLRQKEAECKRLLENLDNMIENVSETDHPKLYKEIKELRESIEDLSNSTINLNMEYTDRRARIPGDLDKETAEKRIGKEISAPLVRLEDMFKDIKDQVDNIQTENKETKRERPRL